MAVVPHKHLCELKMTDPGNWKKYCPHKANLEDPNGIKGNEDRCDDCDHLVIVEFRDNRMLTIDKIIRRND